MGSGLCVGVQFCFRGLATKPVRIDIKFVSQKQQHILSRHGLARNILADVAFAHLDTAAFGGVHQIYLLQFLTVHRICAVVPQTPIRS